MWKVQLETLLLVVSDETTLTEILETIDLPVI
jgi:hypothetical protein